MYSERCKKCIVEGCPDTCHVKQEYKQDEFGITSKTFVVNLPTGDKFIKADGYRVYYDDENVVFFNTDSGILTTPVAHFMLRNIYGWSEYHG